MFLSGIGWSGDTLPTAFAGRLTPSPAIQRAAPFAEEGFPLGLVEVR